MPEVIEDGVTGYVVDSIEDAVEAVERVAWLDRSKCRQVFNERFDATRMARNYLDVYRRLVHGGKLRAQRSPLLQPSLPRPTPRAGQRRKLAAGIV